MSKERTIEELNRLLEYTGERLVAAASRGRASSFWLRLNLVCVDAIMATFRRSPPADPHHLGLPPTPPV